MRGGRFLILSLFPLALSACVERWLIIRSEPSGAEVFLNGVKQGETPLKHQFDYYGDYEISLRKDKFVTMKTVEPIEAPWWQIFPFDLFTDALLPFSFVDQRELIYRMDAQGPPEPAEKVQERAAEMRKKLEEKK